MVIFDIKVTIMTEVHPIKPKFHAVFLAGSPVEGTASGSDTILSQKRSAGMTIGAEVPSIVQGSAWAPSSFQSATGAGSSKPAMAAR
jgi:hypothetical protein